jgi:hypothetical protein
MEGFAVRIARYLAGAIHDALRSGHLDRMREIELILPAPWVYRSSFHSRLRSWVMLPIATLQ